jgi:uncharacterized protein YcbX
MIKISQLFIYPVKSLAGISVNAAQLTDRGFQYDRRWMLVDEQTQFMTQRQFPEMALLQTGISEEGISIVHKKNSEKKILIPFSGFTNENLTVKIWNDYCDALPAEKFINEWFSEMLQFSCKLVYMPDDSLRKVNGRYAVENTDITSFSDACPVLLIGQSSLDDLNTRLEIPLPMNRFRPNIVITGSAAFEEDEMEEFLIGGIQFFGVKLCERCVITTINQDTSEKSKEPLKTLSSYRMQNNNVYFGQNVISKKTGVVRIGDELMILKRKASIQFEIS